MSGRAMPVRHEFRRSDGGDGRVAFGRSLAGPWRVGPSGSGDSVALVSGAVTMQFASHYGRWRPRLVSEPMLLARVRGL
jgi:hypothetical protein